MALNKILLSDNLTELANVKSVVYKEVVNSDVNIRPGCVASASIEVEVYGTQANAVSAGDTVYYYQIDKNNTQTLIGIFTCEPSIETKTSYKFVAYDNAQKLNADFSQWLQANQSNFPMTIYNLVSAACIVAGVTLGSSSWGLSTQNVEAFYSAGITCRDVLSYAAEIGCCFVRCHTNGAIYFDWYASNANTIAPSVGIGQYAYRADGLTYANFTTAALDRVAVHPSGEDDVAYIYPTAVSSGNTIHIQNNLLLIGASDAFFNAVAQNIYTVMSALGTYKPMSVNLFARENPFRAGDIVGVTDIQGVSFTSIITSMTVTSSGATLESTGYETYGEEQGNTQKALTQLASDVVRINKLKVDWADINQAIINYLTANNVTAQNITIVDENDNVLATFDSSGIVLGDTTATHVEINENSLTLYDKDGNVYFSVKDMRDPSGTTTVTDTFICSSNEITYFFSYTAKLPVISVKLNGTSITPADVFNNAIDLASYPNDGDVLEVTYDTLDPIYNFLFGRKKSGSTQGAFSIGTGNEFDCNGVGSASIGGKYNTTSGRNSAILGGDNNNATAENAAVVGGTQNTASNNKSVVVGGSVNVASGLDSTIIGGENNTVDGTTSAIVGGANNQVNSNRSVILGGLGCVSNHDDQVVSGAYNSPGNYAEIVGNGSSNARSNIRTLDWNGNETLSGGLTLGTPLAIESGGTNATDAPSAIASLGGRTFKRTSITSSTTATISCSGATACVLVASGADSTRCGMYIIWFAGVSNNPIIKTISSASALTLTVSAGKIVVSANSIIYLDVMALQTSTFANRITIS